MFRRINGRPVKEQKVEIVVRDGHRMAVLRPMTPEAAQKALAAAQRMAEEKSDDSERFDRILADQGKMMFMGLLGKNGRILDPQTFEDLGPLVAGDSFISYEELLQMPPELMERPS